jgi:hypothetical protein
MIKLSFTWQQQVSVGRGTRVISVIQLMQLGNIYS